jgi:hypothetical protein
LDLSIKGGRGRWSGRSTDDAKNQWGFAAIFNIEFELDWHDCSIHLRRMRKDVFA